MTKSRIDKRRNCASWFKQISWKFQHEHGLHYKWNGWGLIPRNDHENFIFLNPCLLCDFFFFFYHNDDRMVKNFHHTMLDDKLWWLLIWFDNCSTVHVTFLPFSMLLLVIICEAIDDLKRNPWFVIIKRIIVFFF